MSIAFAAVLLLVPAMIFAGGGADDTGASATGMKADYTGNPYTEGKDLSGKKVTIFGALVDEDAARFAKAVEPFEKATGIDIVYEGSGDFETLITIRAEGGSPPDIAAFPQPGLAADLVAGGYIQDMNKWLGMDFLKKQYNDAWLDLASIGGIQAGVWYRASVKSLVWYNKPTFEQKGYKIPQTWDELLKLSDRMVADGFIPWTIGIESSGATGWVATDWLEDIMLRIHPPEVYDRWVAGELKFNSPEFRKALDYLKQIWFNDKYVLGGREGIVLTPFGDAATPITLNPPAALMHRQASFITAFMPQKGAEVGSTVGFFYLPPINAKLGKPVLGAGDIFSAMQDRPEVRAAMRFFASGISTKGWVEQGGFLSPHKDTSFEWYPTDTERGIAKILQNATTFRFDGSDLMPGAVGAGTFWSEITAYVNDEGANLDQLLNNIDKSWP
ncbi:MAG: ABC transporter substrate-binding protein [Spirochaeta sp. LUC14_002_19_P3]|nr:MAG: ABC transporter substrate-binding protein [Spirochaeta sp. LUC14_002_19_P3]